MSVTFVYLVHGKCVSLVCCLEEHTHTHLTGLVIKRSKTNGDKRITLYRTFENGL